MANENKLKVVFVPGCFDSFEGSQEELDGLMAEINRLVDTGELFEKSQPIDMENLDEDDLEALEALMESEKNAKGRTLQ